jgi:hypothetical protein
VIPVVVVKPGIGGFVPVEGISIGNVWSKSQVKPILLVRQSIGGFVPREGTSIGNTWRQEEILPVMLVEPSVGGFIPLHLLATGSESNTYPPSSMPRQTTPLEGMQRISQSCSFAIETQVDGDFEGWEGETIVKLTNGQIWQQTEYQYRYYYAFMPRALIFNSGSGCKMMVDGVDKPVGVNRLK